MEKITNFEEKASLVLGFHPRLLDQDATSEKIKEYIQKKKTLEALLLTITHMDTENWNPVICKHFVEICGIDLTKEKAEHARWSDSNEFVDRIMHQNVLDVYEFAMSLFAVRPLGDTTITLFFFLHEELNENSTSEIAIIKEILRFYEANERYADILFKAFRLLSDSLSGDLRNKICSLIAQKLLAIKKEEILISLYWYYSYIGEQEIAEIVISNIPLDEGTENQFHLSLFELFSWPDFPIENIKEKYKHVQQIRRGEYHRKGVTVSGLFFGKKLPSLVPLCLYARALGDVETEIAVILALIRKNPVNKFFERLEEISGCKISTKTREDFLEKSGKYSVTIQNIAQQCFLGKALSRENIAKCKEAYALLHLSPVLLKGMLGIYSYQGDKEVREMFEYSVSKIEAQSTLYDLIRGAMHTDSLWAFELLTKKFNRLGHTILRPEGLMGDIQYMYRKLNQNSKGESVKLILQAIKFFQRSGKKSKDDNERSKKIEMACKNFKITQISQKFQATTETREHKAEIMFNNRRYYDLLSWFNSDDTVSVEILELMLKAALNEGLGGYVMRIYKALAEQKPARAVSYNMEVEPFILVANRRSKQVSIRGTKNIVSGVWQIPAILENPVNGLGRRISNFAK